MTKYPNPFNNPKLSPYECFQAYMGLKLHFNSGGSYDWFKYHGKVKTATLTAFEARRDRYGFMKLAKQKDPIGMLVAVFLSKPKAWIGDMHGEDAEALYAAMKAHQESLMYQFKKELDKNFNEADSIDDILEVQEGQAPLLFNSVWGGSTSLGTLIVLQKLLNFYPYWDAEIQNPIWKDVRKTADAYAKFIEVDIVLEKAHNILSDRFPTTTK